MIERTCAMILLFYSTTFCQPDYNPDYIYDSIDSLVWKAIVQVDAERFDSALAIFDEVINADTTSPRGYFFVAATYLNLTFDYRNYSYKDDFHKHVNRAIEIGERKEKSGQATAEDLFYYGGAVGYRGIFRSFDGDWWGAFKDGLKGRSLLGKALEADSSFKDIYFGFGTYDYWRSAKTKILWWLPFFSDKRDHGIEETWKAAREGKFSSHEGRYALMRIHYDYGKYDMVLSHWEEEVKQFNPQDPFSLYWVGQAYIKVGQFDKALESFETILSVYIKSPYYDPAGEMECRYYIGLCQSELGNYQKALDHLLIASLMAESLSDRKDIEEALENVGPLLRSVQQKILETQE
jgi:tetratricopeptide (TPR) repeat protein